FYHGDGVAERMALVRGAIAHVRTKWQDYPALMDGLRRLIQETSADPLPSGNREALDKVWSSSKEWIDRKEESNAAPLDNYSVIRLYTSTFGYQQVFKIADSILRTNTSISRREEALNSAVFLVELFNIDLFNYVSVTKDADNFQGVVFRALPASDELLHSFKDLAATPVAERHWAIPLAIVSTSRNQDTAMAYANEEVATQSGRHLFLWRIHVVELETELLQVYRDRFPSSVVSTICAVPIRDLSQFPEEDEVVLRGPFFQLIRMDEEVLESAGKVHVMDSIMLNVNRDHPSTMELGEAEGRRARELIACLVGMGRAKACKRLAEEYGLADDMQTYQQLYEEGSDTLRNLVSN
ncbi:hypothetical protein FPV67DRAFT_1406263, partial [Lyophyllum atratum]